MGYGSKCNIGQDLHLATCSRPLSRILTCCQFICLSETNDSAERIAFSAVLMMAVGEYESLLFKEVFEMARRQKRELRPRNGHLLYALTVSRISGCKSQKEVSLEDQFDHSKEEVEYLYEGEVEYDDISTKGKGERLDRPELAEIERKLRTRKYDILVMEDVGRLVRGTDAVRLWGIAVDHGTRCIAPNDCLDTNDENWEEDLIAACRDHVGHNAHTSKRLKKKLMNRFVKGIGATPIETAGYEKPEGAKTFDDWRKLEQWSPTIKAGARILLTSKNCSQVADLFEKMKFPVGKYCRNKEWDGKMVRRYYANPMLKGMPARGHKHTDKHHETGRRISVPNPDGPNFVGYPHLAHLDAQEFDDLNAGLNEANKNCGRKKINGNDPQFRVPKKRTRFPGQHAHCWYCGRQLVWGGNGMKDKLMCSGAREWKCWNSIGLDGPRLVELLIEEVQQKLFTLDTFDAQFNELVAGAMKEVSGAWDVHQRELTRREHELTREKQNILDSIKEFGPRALIREQLNELEAQEREVLKERSRLERSRSRQLQLPQSVGEMRSLFGEQFRTLAVTSPEFGDLFRAIVPEIYVFLVRSCDGGHPVLRAKVTLNLGGISPDSLQVPQLSELLTYELTVSPFEVPQRCRIRLEAARLTAQGLTQREICEAIDEKPTLPAVQRAMCLHRQMVEQGIDDPYQVLFDPPADYSKLRRHKNKRYQFQVLEGYVRPAL